MFDAEQTLHKSTCRRQLPGKRFECYFFEFFQKIRHFTHNLYKLCMYKCVNHNVLSFKLFQQLTVMALRRDLDGELFNEFGTHVKGSAVKT